ncbi:MAG TPA: glycoside hydrolase family 9 protein [Polyangiaceae bacterium]|nr:glycoside hydrolase family 9 protein [Polyangiaceae bacterium]
MKKTLPSNPSRPLRTPRFSAGSVLALTSCALCSVGPACVPKRAQPNAPAAAAPTPSVVPSSTPAGGELLGRSTFDGDRTLPWMPLFLEPATGDTLLKDGGYCARIDHPGKNAWDVQLRHREMTIQKGHTYSVRYSLWASAPIQVRAQIGMSGPPYTSYWSDVPRVTSSRQTFTGSFTPNAPDDPTAEFAFHLGDPGAKGPVTICIDDLHLTDPAFTPVAKAPEPLIPAIRVNQVGYFPKGPKRATWVVKGTDAERIAKQAVPFELVSSAGSVVHHGTTQPFGKDPTSGSFVQRIDFSSYNGTAEGLRLRLGAPDASGSVVTSDAFSIQPAALKRLSRDALRYFYYTRSGIALEQPFVEQQHWVRPAGHPTDKQVPCAPDAKCSYALDVSGGWYDAGDFGKYVVNGGLSAWLLLNLWEATQQLNLPVTGAKDSELHLPESGNQVPDLLDEARWEVEWLLKMQVPAGDPNAGLVHHKMHDTDWSALGTLPVLGSTPRLLRPVSTAATLNLAATAAQAARVFARFDPKFAERCLAAAKRAWAAAEAHPALLIGKDDNHGGGPYDDANLSDERFWAASELFATTGDPAFFAVVSKSPHYLRLQAHESATPEAFDWRTTDALGTLTLALAARSTPAVREANRKSVVAVAEKYLALSKADGFGQPYTGSHYVWGSNSFIVNNGLILAYAHAFTKDARFLEGAVAAMDYVLGRNALGRSYVSGYGTRALTNPHHRLWAHSIDPKFPPPPPGVLAGGPNSDLQDPYSKGMHPHCIGQTCYVDHIEAYSANEEAINWNAALAWLSAYLNATL